MQVGRDEKYILHQIVYRGGHHTIPGEMRRDGNQIAVREPPQQHLFIRMFTTVIISS